MCGPQLVVAGLYRSWRDIGGTVRMIRSRFAILGPHLFGVLVLSIAGIVQATNATTLSTFALASDVSAPIATLVFLGLALCVSHHRVVTDSPPCLTASLAPSVHHPCHHFRFPMGPIIPLVCHSGDSIHSNYFAAVHSRSSYYG